MDKKILKQGVHSMTRVIVNLAMKNFKPEISSYDSVNEHLDLCLKCAVHLNDSECLLWLSNAYFNISCAFFRANRKKDAMPAISRSIEISHSGKIADEESEQRAKKLEIFALTSKAVGNLKVIGL
jgi:hypothetical protein